MEPEKKSNGALMGLIIIILLLVVGGVYVWQSNENALQGQDEETSTITEKDSVELDSLEASLETTDTDIGVDIETVK